MVAAWCDSPLHDCRPGRGPMVTTGEGLAAGWLRCVACGNDVEPTAWELAQAVAADQAWWVRVGLTEES